MPERFDRGLLVGPQEKESIPLRRSLQGREHCALRRGEIALRYRRGLRQFAQLLDVDADRVVAPEREHAAIAAVRDAELEVGAVAPPGESWLPMTVAGKDQCRGVRIAIASEYPPYDAMRLNEASTITLERELRRPGPLLPAQNAQLAVRCTIAVDEAGSPHMDFADR